LLSIWRFRAIIAAMKPINYIELTNEEVGTLNRADTVFISAISPIEAHGPHLPLGTDIFVAEKLRDRIAERLVAARPETKIIYLPTLALGSDPIPVKGSISIGHQGIQSIVFDIGKSLSDLGFKYWILTDNHGGPHHQMAIELSARRLAGMGFNLIAPFHSLFRRMVGHDSGLLEKTGLKPGTCGDSDDAHGGTNETSLCLASFADKMSDLWKSMGPGKKSDKKLQYHALSAVSKLLSALGARDAALDFDFLAHALTWVSDPEMSPYQGDPSKASAEAGVAMLDYHADLAVDLYEQARSGKTVEQKPLGWSIRAIRNIV